MTYVQFKTYLPNLNNKAINFMELLLPKDIESKILEDYLSYQILFVEFQSKFLTNIYNRYQGVEKGNLVLYYAKQTQQAILRQKDYNLNFNISY